MTETDRKVDNIERLLLRAMTSAAATFSKRGGTVTVRFGTNDIRQRIGGSAGPYECWRVYESPVKRSRCGHKHKNLKATRTCARSMASGEWAESTGKSWVEILPWEDTRIARPSPVSSDCVSWADATHVRVERIESDPSDPTMVAYPFLDSKKEST